MRRDGLLWICGVSKIFYDFIGKIILFLFKKKSYFKGSIVVWRKNILKFVSDWEKKIFFVF